MKFNKKKVVKLLKEREIFGRKNLKDLAKDEFLSYIIMLED